jgi:hypothetical protein
MAADHPTAGLFHPGDAVEVNIAGLSPVTVTEVLLDPEAHEDWHPAEVIETLDGGLFSVHVLPLVGAIEIPPVPASRLRRR